MPRWYANEQTELSQLRMRAGLSRDKAAVMLGVAPNTLLRYEHGKNDIGLAVIDDMVSLYGVSFDEVCRAARRVRKFVSAQAKTKVEVKANDTAETVSD